MAIRHRVVELEFSISPFLTETFCKGSDRNPSTKSWLAEDRLENGIADDDILARELIDYPRIAAVDAAKEAFRALPERRFRILRSNSGHWARK